MKISAYLSDGKERMRAYADSGITGEHHWVDCWFGSEGSFSVFVPSRAIAERLAAGINAAWQEPQDDAGDACPCPEHKEAAE